MCGRFTLTTPPESLSRIFRLVELPELSPRYNIAPTQAAPGVIRPAGESARVFRLFRWGLVPFWAKDPKIGYRMINARAETVAEKPAYREAFRRRRCLVLSDGFYEWKPMGRWKQPYYIHLRDREPFAFAGLWERWKPPDGEPLETCTLITTEPNELLAELHDRMPVILEEKDYDLWLDPEPRPREELEALLRPLPAELMAFHAVSRKVNNPRFDASECIEPAPEAAPETES